MVDVPWRWPPLPSPSLGWNPDCARLPHCSDVRLDSRIVRDVRLLTRHQRRMRAIPLYESRLGVPRVHTALAYGWERHHGDMMGCVGLTISSTFCCFSRRKGDLTSRAICRKHSIVTCVCCLGGDDYDDDDESSECRKVRMVVVNERSRSVTIYKSRDRCQLRNTKSKDSASSSNQQIDQQKRVEASKSSFLSITITMTKMTTMTM